MRRMILVTWLVLGLASTAAAQLASETETFLREAGLDPKSPRVTTVAGDIMTLEKEHNIYPDKVDLNVLAKMKMANAARRFIATRNFVRDYRRDQKTSLPKEYDSAFVTAEERTLIAPAIKKAGDEFARELEKKYKRK